MTKRKRKVTDRVRLQIGLRMSSAHGKHKDRRTNRQRTRTAQRNRDINDSKEN